MHSRAKLLAAAAASVILISLASPASALEAQPGDACPVAGRYILSGGPELSGASHLMVCTSGNIWSSILDNDAVGNAALAHAVSLSGDISPAQITANENDYNPAGLSTALVLRVNSDASRNITSLAGGADGRIVTIMNIGSFPVVLKNDDGATGTAANRFALTGDLTLAAKQSAMLIYDSTASRWRQIANGTASGSGDNLGNHTATANIQLNGHYLSGDGDNEGIQVLSTGDAALTSPIAGSYFTIQGIGDSTNYSVLSLSNLVDNKRWSIIHRMGAGDTNKLFFEYYNGSSYAVPLTVDTSGNVGIGTTGPIAGLDAGTSIALSGDITPTQITANQNDYNPAGLSGASVLRLTSNAAVNITGLAGGADGRTLTIFNIGTNNIVLKNQSGSSALANRFAINADFTLGADQSVSLIYDSTSQRWRSASIPFSVSGLSGPAGCANIGDLCADGTVFAGWDPVRHEPLYIPPTDQGTTSTWKTSTGTNDIATDSTYDGRANTNQVANSTTFPAFKLCKDLTTGGHSDWYLPSQVEHYYLWTMKGTIQAGGHITNFLNANYWSSTEYTTTTAWYQNFTSGIQTVDSKNLAYRVRCVRR